VFSLVAPVRVLAPEDTLAAPAAATAAEALSRKVLIVDDSAATRRLAKVFLQEAGHRAITASSGSQALQALRQEHFDAIITDLRMPGMDGLAFARAVRARPERYGEAPILAFSADHDQWDAPAVRAAGVQGFLTKPFTPSSLLLALEGAIAAAPETRTSAA
jgi:CheY-like chemotaxis protein